jgi:hypothetical protein
MSWELSIPNPSCPGTFEGGTVYKTKEDVIRAAKSVWGADDDGKVCIVNELPDEYDGDEEEWQEEPFGGSHTPDCPYRLGHGAECLCWRSDPRQNPELRDDSPPTCILTGADGENPDDCTTHDHEAASVKTAICLECGATQGTYHHPSCGKRVIGCPTVVAEDCQDDDFGTEESCPRSPDGKHHPNWQGCTVEYDGDGIYVDVPCIHCGRSGCVGSTETLEADVSW